MWQPGKSVPFSPYPYSSFRVVSCLLPSLGAKRLITPRNCEYEMSFKEWKRKKIPCFTRSYLTMYLHTHPFIIAQNFLLFKKTNGATPREHKSGLAPPFSKCFLLFPRALLLLSSAQAADGWYLGWKTNKRETERTNPQRTSCNSIFK